MDPEEELTPVQLLAAETLAAQSRRRRAAQTGPHQPVASPVATASALTGPQPRVQPSAPLAPLMPVTGPQPLVQPAAPAPIAVAPPTPVTGPQPRVQPAAAAPAPASPQVLDYLSPEERAIVEAQRQSTTAAPKLPEPPTTRARFVSAPVATCAHRAGTTRPSHPRLPVVNPRPSRQLRAMRPVGTHMAVEPASSAASATQDWTAMLKAYGEHLTDEELLVLRAQLS